MVKIGVLFGLLGLLLLANTCSAAGLTLSVVAENGTISVQPGQSISYIATVSDDELIEPEDVQFSINRTNQEPNWNPDWNYKFNPSKVRLESQTESKSSILTFDVPEGTTPGVYYHTIQINASSDFEQSVGIKGRITVNVINTNVNNIPEFPSIALPAVAVLGLVAIIGRKKE
ncbi:hypothetical protein EO98_16710 [Methanosarcina sp. 2.H.T.1A.6]|uniref:PEF-CTERM sorting domain-containing protein n=1 Tax=unclassified Methanosarcina TaxID=2644672 RepID=UPI000620F030|nr:MULTISPECIES: PEF-CTERM sorting domain-containing protein [unclassified Methanosarcina]KKG15007.1 hypothetical protein EO94_03765 [Methanosarcina sp. 2.H.T.1A.3]KKG16935.1 hypothetical protein EO97_19615 [Methanosarcina sp. 2.H.T.1A.15]KKG20706.1 hypothetical protein EO96_17755 [Methanosarcina sp. 2.H.T.1A.8]KKG22023.1 hypothetical protein EO98_16710 [Methanosarcina sp. 2.H.T.1A.6]